MYLDKVFAKHPNICFVSKKELIQSSCTYGILHLRNRRLKSVKQSAISDHSLTCDCNITFNDFTILSKDSNDFSLLIKETLLIARYKHILNKMVKSSPLELFE